MKQHPLVRETVFVLKELVRQYITDKIPEVGGTLAYFFLLSIFPFFIFLNAILGFMNLSIDQIIRDLSLVAPNQVIILLEGYLRSVVNTKNTGLLSFGLLASLFSASKALSILISVLNTAYEVKETRNIFRVKLLSILLTMAMGLSIVTMLLLPVLSRNVVSKIADFFHLSHQMVNFWLYIRWLIVFVVLFATIASLYHYGPNDKSSIRKAIPGTIFTMLSWTLISLVFASYVNHFGRYSAVYGSIGAVIILMIWFYLSGIIIMMGGELNHILYKRKQSAHREGMINSSGSSS